jgi:hypothetical protein
LILKWLTEFEVLFDDEVNASVGTGGMFFNPLA